MTCTNSSELQKNTQESISAVGGCPGPHLQFCALPSIHFSYFWVLNFASNTGHWYHRRDVSIHVDHSNSWPPNLKFGYGPDKSASGQLNPTWCSPSRSLQLWMSSTGSLSSLDAANHHSHVHLMSQPLVLGSIVSYLQLVCLQSPGLLVFWALIMCFNVQKPIFYVVWPRFSQEALMYSLARHSWNSFWNFPLDLLKETLSWSLDAKRIIFQDNVCSLSARAVTESGFKSWVRFFFLHIVYWFPLLWHVLMYIPTHSHSA